MTACKLEIDEKFRFPISNVPRAKLKNSSVTKKRDLGLPCIKI